MTTKIHPLLDAEKQVQARKYESEKRTLGLLGSFISLITILVIYFSGFSYWLANLNPEYPVVVTFLVYIIGFLIITTVIGLPLGYYSGYIREHHWGFSNHTIYSWFMDQFKSFLVGLVLTPILLGLLLWCMYLAPENWWLIAGLAVAVVSVIMATLLPVVILPIFNKYTPIESGELTDRLSAILGRAGLKPSGFFIEDMSRQTKKENAFLAGLGKTRRVVLADNLLNNMSTDEIESVIAHEVGHYKYHHIWKNIIIGTGQQLIVFFLLDWLMRTIFPEFLSSLQWNLTLLPVFFLFMGLINGVLFGPLSNAISRYFERQADHTALEMIAEPEPFLTAMAGLANRNLSNAYPQNWVKWLYYSHPPIGERLAFGDSWAGLDG